MSERNLQTIKKYIKDHYIKHVGYDEYDLAEHMSTTIIIVTERYDGLLNDTEFINSILTENGNCRIAREYANHLLFLINQTTQNTRVAMTA